MPLRRDEAFVLARYPFRERDFVVVLLGRAGGQLRVVARRVRALRASHATATEPLAHVRVSYFERVGSELATLDEAEVVRSAFDLASRPPAWAAGQVVAELALVYTQPGQRNEPAFRLVERCVTCLLDGHDPAAVAWYAELWFLRLGGVFPELARCGVCGGVLPVGPRLFDSIEKRFVCAEHRPAGGAARISAAGVEWLQRASRLPLEQIGEVAPADAARWLVSLREAFTEREVKSWRYLRLLLKDGAEADGSR
ncbi:MAG: DNA repair protein RecO [Acidobacteria bacterium 37-65-4]|nr:MAG: DNA repair protein RecO [Acidobacteria bacterium 37-65-4]HQT95425.1 DNA repair protein RecO [Thermoanaerobaculaceae bacterium]